MRASNRVAVASFARSTRENFRSRRSPRVFHTPARPTESRFDDDPFENNRPMPILRRRSFYSGPTVAPIFYHTPSPHRSSLVATYPVSETFTWRKRIFSVLDEKRDALLIIIRVTFDGKRARSIAAENSQAISDVYLVRVVLDRSGRRIWFGKIAEKLRATWQLASILSGYSREWGKNGTLATLLWSEESIEVYSPRVEIF